MIIKESQNEFATIASLAIDPEHWATCPQRHAEVPIDLFRKVRFSVCEHDLTSVPTMTFWIHDREGAGILHTQVFEAYKEQGARHLVWLFEGGQSPWGTQRPGHFYSTVASAESTRLLSHLASKHGVVHAYLQRDWQPLELQVTRAEVA